MGYTGGPSSASAPTYKSVCSGDGHTEALRLEFDPEVVSYEELMELVIRQASTGRGRPQYMSAVWTTDAEQAATAKKIAAKLGKQQLPILPAKPWYDAEEYHQKYMDKMRGTIRDRGGRACGGGAR